MLDSGWVSYTHFFGEFVLQMSKDQTQFISTDCIPVMDHQKTMKVGLIPWTCGENVAQVNASTMQEKMRLDDCYVEMVLLRKKLEQSNISVYPSRKHMTEVLLNCVSFTVKRTDMILRILLRLYTLQNNPAILKNLGMDHRSCEKITLIINQPKKQHTHRHVYSCLVFSISGALLVFFL